MDKIVTINKQTGLTPQQEKAAALLVTGKNYTDVAKELKVDRTTLYIWADKITFKTYFNKLCKQVQKDVENGLQGMFNDALKAVGETLKSTNPNIKFKVASWIIEKLQNQTIENHDIQYVLKRMATKSKWNNMLEEEFDINLYKRLCNQHGIDPKDFA